MIGIGPGRPAVEPREAAKARRAGAPLEAEGARQVGAPAPSPAEADGVDVAAVGRGGHPRAGASRPSASPDHALSDDERWAWAALSTVTGLGPVGLGRLLAAFGTGVGVLEAATAGAPIAEIAAGARGGSRAGGGSPARASGASRAAARSGAGDGHPLGDAVASAAREVERIAAALAAHDVTVVPLVDDAYPARLRSIELPPPVLFVRGDLAALQAARAVALVGTRRPTDAGRRAAARLTTALVQHGAVVVSGLAVGIDGVAHAAAVAERGRTVAVLGGGHGRLYPRTHRRLAEEIVAAGGAVVSELPPATEPTRGTFPRRNRLISGLSDATIVVEAGEGSGALITAGWALEQGRDCFAVPGPLDAPTSRGCLALLRDYAGQVRVVAGIAELMEDLGLDQPDTGWLPDAGSGNPASPERLGALESTVAAALVERAQTADELAGHSRMPVAAVLGAITLLEARGLVVGVFGRYQATPRLLVRRPAPADQTVSDPV